MGEVRVTVKLTNASDEVLQRQRKLAPRRVRKYQAQALVDTGAVRTVIPTEVVKRLGIGIRGDPDHEHDRDGGPQPAEQRGPPHLLPDRRPRGVNPRSRTMSPLRVDPLRYVSSHAWGAQGFYAFQFQPTEGK